MESELGYNRTELRVLVRGNSAVRPYEVDIKAEKSSRLWDWIKGLAIIAVAVAVLTLASEGEMPDSERLMRDIVSAVDERLANYAVIIIGVTALILAYLGKKKGTRRAWVECKDTKSSVNRAQVQKLISSVKDVREFEHDDWSPNVVIMVSGSDFDIDAINIADANDVICYRRCQSGFEEV